MECIPREAPPWAGGGACGPAGPEVEELCCMAGELTGRDGELAVFEYILITT